MSIGQPRTLLLLLLVAPLLVAIVRAYVKGRGEIVRLGTQWSEDAVARLYLIKCFFVGLGQIGFVVFAILGAADVTLGVRSIEEDRSGVDVAFLLDLSRSMLASDVNPNRLSRAVGVMQSMTRELEVARFSLVGFKGSGVTILPVTEDLNALDTIATALGPDLIVGPGTNLEAGIIEALRSLPASSFATRVIILLSDGEALEGEIDDALTALRADGVPLFAVAIGTEAGSTIPGPDGSPIADESGRPVVSRVDRAYLRELADRSGGAFLDLQAQPQVGALAGEVSSLATTRETEGFRLVPRRRYRFFLAMALVSLGLSTAVRAVRWKEMF